MNEIRSRLLKTTKDEADQLLAPNLDPDAKVRKI